MAFGNCGTLAAHHESCHELWSLTMARGMTIRCHWRESKLFNLYLTPPPNDSSSKLTGQFMTHPNPLNLK
ncbi:hypothetical protein HAX54_029915, partial [Datura stramonium]|nr:hypothetical protein [Datura stramonium]